MQRFLLSQIVVVLISLHLLQCAPATEHHLQKRQSVRLCGRVLYEALTMICGYDFMVPQDSVQSEIGLTRNSLEHNEESNYTVLPSRVRRGIVDECCRNICTYNTLLSYCRHDDYES